MTFSFRLSRVAVAALLLWSTHALARPYVTVRDDGTFQTFSSSATVASLSAAMMALYDKTGQPRPQTLSCWFGFPLGGELYGTFFLPQSNSVKGLGFNAIFGGDGTFKGAYGPEQAILLHNNGLDLAERAAINRAADQDPIAYGSYLFLLEFSHQYLAAVRVPGSKPGELGTWPHWSFWYSSGGSPPGGNIWQDNGDGTFSTQPITPGHVKYSMLDLYLMGLAAPSEVGDIEVLENPVAPATPKDPTTGQPYATASLTDFDAAPLTVTATKKTYSIGDIVTVNGARVPATAPASATVGFVFVVSQDAGEAEIEADHAAFDPVAVAFPGAYAAATSGRGSLEVVTWEDGGIDLPAPDAGPQGSGDDGGDDAGTDAGATPDAGATGGSKGGCSTGTGLFAPLGLLLLLALIRRPTSA